MNFLITTWEYILVFVFAAAPWVEILLVIPVAIASGLSPIIVVIVAFAGNALPVWGIIVVYDKWLAWRNTRDHKALVTETPLTTESTDVTLPKSKLRAQKVWDRYGLPGLALLAPAVTGIHLATIMALAFKSSHKATAFWMTLSLILWAIATGIISYYGLSLFFLNP